MISRIQPLATARSASLAGLAIALLLFAHGLSAATLQTATRAGADPAATLSAAVPARAITSLDDITNAAAIDQAALASENSRRVASSNSIPENLLNLVAETNGLPAKAMSEQELLAHTVHRLEIARYLRNTRQPHDAEPILVDLLGDKSPEFVKQSALLELAAVAEDEGELTRANHIYSQFVSKWPNDLRIPEILLRQGMLFRKQGLYNVAFTKFYGVMTSALVLKNEQMDYYVRLVLQAQTEIAETQYQLGRYTEAADFFSRLLKQNSPHINQPLVLYKLAACHAAINQPESAVSDCMDYLVRFPNGPEQAEIRFNLAQSLNKLNRNNESLQQVLLLLQEQRARTAGNPEAWAYWQQRTGNLIANQLYREGDFFKAIEIYQRLAELDPSPAWQLPVRYQMAMCYERLYQPQKAAEIYQSIADQEKKLGPDAPLGLKTMFDMARWRIHFIQWQGHAESALRQSLGGPSTNSPTAGLPASPPVAVQ
ncbi:MAG: tetratricopeptide repeat protein [Verrucomicrobiota bacterium]